MDYRTQVQNLIDNFQDGFPLTELPYAFIASQLSLSEAEVLDVLSKMQTDGMISRIGPIYRTHRVGYSLLAACSCEEKDLEKFAEIINSYKEVNHNYERENKLNLWFVVTAADKESVYNVCREIEKKCGTPVLCFPMIKPYKIDLSVTEKINWDLL